MRRKVISNLLFLVVFGTVTLLSQNNFLNNPSVYEFLNRQEVLGRININHHQKPFTRAQVSKYLSEINEKKSSLNSLDQKELEYYLAEYNISPHHLLTPSPNSKHYLLEKNNTGAFRFYEYNDSNFNFTLYPDIGASYTIRDQSKSNFYYYNGMSAYGNLGKHISFDFKFNDFSFSSNDYPISRLFNQMRGFDYLRYFSDRETYNYDRTRAAITFSWKWGLVSLKKDYNYWGTGYNGKLILSDKAPSFPHLQLKLCPFDDVEFNYIYGELNSMVYDSTTFRQVEISRPHIQLIPKYYVAHFLTFNLFSNLKISLGESITFSDRFEPIYLVPFLFFRMADHYLSKSDYNSGNAQIFSSVSYRIPSTKTRLDASLFIDELSISDLSGEEKPAIVAYNFGLTNFDLLIENVGLQLEYTRINPAVYLHSDPVQTYANKDYQLGHWIGSNADQLYFNLIIKPIPLLHTNLSYEYTRKGHYELNGENLQEEGRDFLFGENSYYSVFRLSIRYELLNNLFLNGDLAISNSWGENNVINVHDYKYQEFSLGFRYGID